MIKIDQFTQELSDYGNANLLRSLGHPTFDLPHPSSNVTDSQPARAQLLPAAIDFVVSF